MKGDVFIEEHPFENLRDFASLCTTLVSYFRNHIALNVRLEQEQDEKKDHEGKKIPHLVLPVPTRWEQFVDVY